MKKLILLTAVAAFAFTSCNNDDDNNEVSLFGTWKLTKATLNAGIDLNNDGTASTNLITESGCLNNSTVIFTDDVASAILKMQSIDVTEQDNGDYTVLCEDGVDEYLPFTVSGDNVTLTSEGVNVIFVKNGNKLTTGMDGAVLEFTKQ